MKKDLKRKVTQSGGAIAPMKAIANPRALPDSPFPMPQEGESAAGAAYLSRVGKWYEHYYLQTFRTFTRAGVGKCMHPGYCHMKMCISLLTKGILYVPQNERARFFMPLKFVLGEIAQAWEDATAPALGALDHAEELQDALNFDVDTPAAQVDQGKIERETNGLKDSLRKLSETLLNANPDEMKKTLARIETKIDDTTAVTGAAKTGIDWLVNDRMNRKAANQERGKASQQIAAPGLIAARKDAAKNKKTALQRVHDDPNVKAGIHGAVMMACRRVCKEFSPLTSKKNALNKYEKYAPLTDWQGNPIQPETLARNFRTRFGTIKKRKRRAKQPSTK